jgi:hypothetical protein
MYVIRKRINEGRWDYVMDDHAGERKRFPSRPVAKEYIRLSCWSKNVQTIVVEEGENQ